MNTEKSKEFIKFSKQPWMPEFKEIFEELQKEIHDTAKSKGWWDKERNDGEAIALMHSEVVEAHLGGHDADDKIPEFIGYEAELADCIIRIMDMAEARDWPVSKYIVNQNTYQGAWDQIRYPEGEHVDPVNLAFNLFHNALSGALESMRKPIKDEKEEIAEHLGNCVQFIFAFCNIYEYRIGAALIAKAEMNKGRAYKHGGKKF